MEIDGNGKQYLKLTVKHEWKLMGNVNGLEIDEKHECKLMGNMNVN